MSYLKYVLRVEQFYKYCCAYIMYKIETIPAYVYNFINTQQTCNWLYHRRHPNPPHIFQHYSHTRSYNIYLFFLTKRPSSDIIHTILCGSEFWIEWFCIYIHPTYWDVYAVCNSYTTNYVLNSTSNSHTEPACHIP